MSGAADTATAMARGPTRAGRSLCGMLVLLAASGAAADSRQHELGEFDRVVFSGAGTVRLTQGSPATLSVHGETGLLEATTIETRDGALYIDTPGLGRHLLLELQVARLTEFISEGDGRITGADLSFDQLRLVGNGGGSFDMQRLEARELLVRSRGATRFDLTGQVDEQVVELSGTGDYRATELISDCATVHVDGASDVRLWAEVLLQLSVAGSADVRYAGSPRVQQHISGVASVQRIAQIAI